MVVLIQDLQRNCNPFWPFISVQVKKLLRKSQAHFTGRCTNIENEAKRSFSYNTKSVYRIADDSHIYKNCREIVFFKCIINSLQKTAKTQQRKISQYFDRIFTKMETESLKSYD